MNVYYTEQPKKVSLHLRVSENFRNEVRNLAAQECGVSSVIRRAVKSYGMRQQQSYGAQLYRQAAQQQEQMASSPSPRTVAPSPTETDPTHEQIMTDPNWAHLRKLTWAECGHVISPQNTHTKPSGMKVCRTCYESKK